MIYSFPRAREFFEPDELVVATGVDRDRFSEVLIKELVDNALDAAESLAEPAVEIGAGRDHLTVSDTGPGVVLGDFLAKVLDFGYRASSKLAWCRPTRGYLGNGLKTVFGLSHVLSPGRPVLLESCGQRVRVSLKVSAAGEVKVMPVYEPAEVKAGLSVTVPVGVSVWPAVLLHTVVFNPHVAFRVGRAIFPAVGSLARYGQDAPVSAHWFDPESLRELFVLVALAEPGLTVREFFAKRFVGLSGAKAGRVAAAGRIKRLSDLVVLEEEAGRNEAVVVCADILACVQELSRPVQPARLGGIGAENLRRRLAQVYAVDHCTYVVKAGSVAGVPYVIEVCFAPVRGDLKILTGLNFTGTYNQLFSEEFFHTKTKSYLYGLKELLNQLKVSSGILAVHLVMPAARYTSHDKRVATPEAVVRAAGDAVVEAVRKAGRLTAVSADGAGVSLKEAVWTVLPEAVKETSDGGKLSYSPRNLYYVVRKRVQALTGEELNWKYFSQALLIEYQANIGALPRLEQDPRGWAVEPHTGARIPLGTREVSEYAAPPEYLYNKVLYVEKKGVLPAFDATRLAERYDLCIVAGEGYASRAAKDFLRMAESQNIIVLCLHDFDINGLEIARTLREATRTAKQGINVLDLGLRYSDVVQLGLQADPEGVRLEKGYTKPVLAELSDEERAFLIGDGRRGNRVELNALTPRQLVDYVEGKLAEYGLTAKVLPPEWVLRQELDQEFSAMVKAMVERRVMEVIDLSGVVQAVLADVDPPVWDNAVAQIGERLDQNPPVSWRELAREFSEAAARVAAAGIPDKVIRGNLKI